MEISDSLGKTIAEFAATCAHSRASPATQAAYSRAVERFCEAAGITDLDGILTLEHAERVVHTMERDLKPASIAQTVSAMKQFYRHLRITTGTLVNPMLDVRVHVGDNVPDWNVLHEGETGKLLAMVTKPRDRAVIMGLALQGWRCSELANMTWKNLRQTKDGWVVEWKAKGRKLRTQRLQDSVLEAIHAIGARESPGDPLIARKGLVPLTRNNIWVIVTKYSDAFGHHVTPHGLRATYISSVIKRKGLEAAQKFAGHKSMDTTQRYNRWTPDSDDVLTPEDL